MHTREAPVYSGEQAHEVGVASRLSKVRKDQWKTERLDWDNPDPMYVYTKCKISFLLL